MLHNGLDLVAIASAGTYTETYKGAVNQARINNLYASFGFLEIAPLITVTLIYVWKRIT